MLPTNAFLRTTHFSRKGPHTAPCLEEVSRVAGASWATRATSRRPARLPQGIPEHGIHVGKEPMDDSAKSIRITNLRALCCGARFVARSRAQEYAVRMSSRRPTPISIGTVLRAASLPRSVTRLQNRRAFSMARVVPCPRRFSSACRACYRTTTPSPILQNAMKRSAP